MTYFIVALTLLVSLTANAKLDSAWIWPAAYPQLKDFKGEAFVLQYEVNAKGHWQRRGPAPHPWKVDSLIPVVRLHSLPSSSIILKRFEDLRNKWKNHGVRVPGFQIDFDSPTGRLSDYKKWLKSLETVFPQEVHLSATGLADWVRDPSGLKGTGFGRFEIFFQMYQETLWHENTSEYLKRLQNSSAPFRIGLLPSQSIDKNDLTLIEQNPHFRGWVRFFGEKQYAH